MLEAEADDEEYCLYAQPDETRGRGISLSIAATRARMKMAGIGLALINQVRQTVAASLRCTNLCPSPGPKTRTISSGNFSLLTE